jgi:hypothetical protein
VSARHELLAVCDRDGLEARVDAEGAEDPANVVPYRLHTEMQFGCDLLSRAAVFEQAQDLGLTRCQVWVRRRRFAFLHFLDLAEDTDHVVASLERYRAHLDCDALAVRIEDDASVVRALRRPHQVPREDFATATPLLGRKNGGHLPASNITHNRPCSGIHPADDSVAIDHVGRDADAMKGVLQIATYRFWTGHGAESALLRPDGQRGPFQGLEPEPVFGPAAEQ